MSVRLITGAAALITALGAAFIGGMCVESNRRDARLLEAERASAQATHRLIESAYRAGQALTQTSERERVVTKIIREQIHEQLPARDPACLHLPAAWRLLHDAAASGTDPAASGRADDPGPSPQDAAQTVVDNYGTYRLTAARLSACQQYITDIVQPAGLEAAHGPQAGSHPRP